jgi:NAD(P)-dependent dehydrogenase (short-subunit alcohol dehydrogenase family)
MPRFDAVVCCAANAPLTALNDDQFVASLAPKLIGQVELTRASAQQVIDGGSIALTSGAIPVGLAHSAGGALVNTGLEAFVRSAAKDMPRAIRLNAVSPGWVRESLEAAGMDPRPGIPAHEVAAAYAALINGNHNGHIITL